VKRKEWIVGREAKGRRSALVGTGVRISASVGARGSAVQSTQIAEAFGGAGAAAEQRVQQGQQESTGGDGQVSGLVGGALRLQAPGESSHPNQAPSTSPGPARLVLMRLSNLLLSLSLCFTIELFCPCRGERDAHATTSRADLSAVGP